MKKMNSSRRAIIMAPVDKGFYRDAYNPLKLDIIQSLLVSPNFNEGCLFVIEDILNSRITSMKSAIDSYEEAIEIVKTLKND